MPVPIAALSALIPSAVQGITGIGQFLKGRKEARNLQRPEYQIPGEVTTELREREMQALEGLPAEVRNQYLQQLAEQRQSGMRSIREAAGGQSASLLQNIGALQRGQQQGIMGLMAQNAMARAQNRAALSQARQVMANQRLAQWQYNVAQPYEEAAAAASAKMGAGMQNIMGGLTNIGQFGAGGGFGAFAQSPTGGLPASPEATLGVASEGAGFGGGLAGLMGGPLEGVDPMTPGMGFPMAGNLPMRTAGANFF